MKFIKEQNNLTQIELENGETINALAIPEGVEKVYGRAFMGLNDIKELSLPSTFKGFIVEAGSDFLSLPTELAKISLNGNNSLYKVTSDCLINTKAKRVELATSDAIIPQNEGIEVIGDYVFNQHFNISEIVVPASVKELGYMSLSGCSVKKITFLGSPKNISPCALTNNRELVEIVMPESEEYEVKDGCVIEKKTKTLLAVVKSAKIPYGIEKLEKGVFTLMPMENDVVIPETVQVVESPEIMHIWGDKKFIIKKNSKLEKIFIKNNIKFEIID